MFVQPIIQYKSSAQPHLIKYSSEMKKTSFGSSVKSEQEIINLFKEFVKSKQLNLEISEAVNVLGIKQVTARLTESFGAPNNNKPLSVLSTFSDKDVLGIEKYREMGIVKTVKGIGSTETDAIINLINNNKGARLLALRKGGEFKFPDLL